MPLFPHSWDRKKQQRNNKEIFFCSLNQTLEKKSALQELVAKPKQEENHYQMNLSVTGYH